MIRRSLPAVVAAGLACFPCQTPAAEVGAAFFSAGDVPITADDYSAEGEEIELSLGFHPDPGEVLKVVDNQGASAIAGEFTNLTHKQIVTLPFEGKRYPFVANYRGGDGNDLVLHWARQSIFTFFQPQPAAYAGPAGLAAVDNTGRMTATPAPEGVLAELPADGVWTNARESYARLVDGTWMGWTNLDMSPLPPPEVFPMTGPLEGKTIRALVPGWRHYLALCEDGTLVAWGINESGQIGNGETASEYSPVPPVGITGSGALAGKTVVQVAAGQRHSLALCSDGSIAAWGDDSSGQLGNVSGSSLTPAPVSDAGALAGQTVVSVHAAGDFSAALCSDGRVVTWGGNSLGQLGNGDIFHEYAPVFVDDTGVLAGKSIVDLALGESHVLALCSDGSMVAWGANHLGNLGDGTRTSSRVPVAVEAPALAEGESIGSVEASFASFLLTDRGRLFGWGGSGADLGVAAPDGGLFPGPMALYGDLAEAGLISFRVGGFSPTGIVALPLKSDSGLAGLELDTAVLNQDVRPEVNHYTAALRGGASEVVVRPTSSDPDAIVSVNDVEIPPGESSAAISVSPGGAALSVVVTAQDGSSTEYTVEFFESSDLVVHLAHGDGPAVAAPAFEVTGRSTTITLGFEPEPGAVIPLMENTGLSFIGGRFSNLAHGEIIGLNFEGLTYHFVANYHGGTGNDLVLEWARRKVVVWGSAVLAQGPDPVPAEVGQAGSLSGKAVLDVAVGSFHALALCSDGSLFAWGRNSDGQLGNGGFEDSTEPLAVDRSGILDGKEVVAIGAGARHSLAICTDGTVVAWGANEHGQLGDGTLTDRPAPVLCLTDGLFPSASPVGLAVGDEHSLIRFSNGRLAAWGSSDDGQVGATPTYGTRFGTPVAVDGELARRTVTSMVAGSFHNHAICDDATIWAWGDNSSGELADGTHEARRLPVEMTALAETATLPIRRFSAGQGFGHAVDSEGRLFSWGKNRDGQLGRGSTSLLEAVGEVDFGSYSGGEALRSFHSGRVATLATTSSRQAFGWGSNANRLIRSDGSSWLSLSNPVALRSDGALAGSSLIKLDMKSGAVALTAVIPSAALAELGVSGGYLSPGFDPEVADYRLNLPMADGPFHLTAVPVYQFAEMRIDGVLTDPAGEPFAINPAMERIEIEVTSDTGEKRLYVIELVGDIAHTFTSADDVGQSFPGYHAAGRTASLSLGFEPQPGTALTVVENLGIDFIEGEFQGLAQGQAVALPFGGRDYDFLVNYHGGTGNDLVLEWAHRELAGWGYNGQHELANGTTVSTDVPVAPTDTGDLAGRTVLSVAIGAGHSVALCSDGTVVVWGDGVAASSATPKALEGALAGKHVIAISAANRNALALCSDGTVAAWGAGVNGQLGNGSLESTAVPVEVDATGVLAGKRIVAISCGGTHCLALASDGLVFSWGSNSDGQLGAVLPTHIPKTVPVAVYTKTRDSWLADRKVTAIATGYQHSLALCDDGSLAGWGEHGPALAGASGSSLPRQIRATGALEGKTVTALSNGASEFTSVLCADGTVVSWGRNPRGELGIGSDVSSTSTPTAVDTTGVLAGKKVVSLASGYQHTIATCADGTIVTWGSQNYGVLGDGTQTDARSPVIPETRGVLFGRLGLSGAAGFHTLAVVAKPASGYIDFISRFSGLDDQRDEGDPDGDGTPNLVEFVNGTRPDVAEGGSLPRVTRSESEVRFSFTRDISSIGHAAQSFEWSPDLVTWHQMDLPMVSGGGVVVGETDVNQLQPVEVSLPSPESGKLFGRIHASRP